MRRRTAFAIGFATGAWVAGSLAPKVLEKVGDLSIRDLVDKVKAVADLGVERIRRGREDAQVLQFPTAVSH